MIYIGSVNFKLGFMGALARYGASEVAFVAKDTLNYLIDGTRDSLTNTVQK